MVNAEQLIAPIFPEEKLKPTPNGCKVNLETLGNDHIDALYDVGRHLDIKIKRSGTGLVVVATAK